MIISRGDSAMAAPRAARLVRLAPCRRRPVARAFGHLSSWTPAACAGGTLWRRAKATARGQRVRESGMPPVDYWEELLHPEPTLDALGFTSGRHVRAVEFGCGYGTFTVPVAQRVQKLHTFDIEEHMVETSRQRLAAAGLEARVELEVRDVLAQGYGLEAEADAVLLMNILHCQEPVQMLRQAAELLEDQGLVYAIHWRYDESTPRGPPMKIRPRPEQLADWAMQTGLLEVERGPIDCPPWHYGWTFRRA
ncbi:unnamed protein product [Effrenium voratum]|uniref:Methyltransferase domain-containing protein n=1 Tax=Effrenium voratum TaxID=2562239 RepID=A0AA36N070_9DINO|nr:unnamed protein product [Effrenium voratum]